MFDGLVVESPLDAYDVGELPLPAEAPREMAIDLGTAPGPFALMMASTVDPAGLSDGAMLDLVGLVEQSITVAHALRGSLIASYADRLATDDPGTVEEQADLDWHREQLAAVCQTSPHEADVRCRTAIALRDRLPATARAVRSGSLPWAQAVVLARESYRLDPDASSAVERAVLADPRATSAVGRVRDATRAEVERLRPTAADQRVQDANTTRTLEFWPGDDGSTSLYARLTTDAAITVAAALEPFAAPGGPDDDRTAEQRRADALVALALGEQPPADQPNRPSTSPGRATRQPVSLTLLARFDPSRPITGGLTGGLLSGGHLGATPTPPETLRRLTCDALVAAAAVGPDGAVGPETTRRRFPDAALRRRLEARDQHCSFPGCPVAARRCHAHHIVHWSRGGPTTPENMIMTCPRHHNAVHDGGWTLRGTATHLTWQDPHGRTYAAPVAAANIRPGESDFSLVELATPDPPDPDPPRLEDRKPDASISQRAASPAEARALSAATAVHGERRAWLPTPENVAAEKPPF